MRNPTSMADILLPSTLLLSKLTLGLLVLAWTYPCSNSSKYISSCHYYGRSCPESWAGPPPNETLPGDSNSPNVSCGANASESVEYCTIGDTDKNLFQCFSLYTVAPNSSERKIALAGCIFGHELSLCTANLCNFSHAVDIGRGQGEFHYCCCHSSELCNGGGIYGWPVPTSPSPSTITSTSRTNTGNAGPSIVTCHSFIISIGWFIATVIVLLLIILVLIFWRHYYLKKEAERSISRSSLTGLTIRNSGTHVIDDSFQDDVSETAA